MSWFSLCRDVVWDASVSTSTNYMRARFCRQLYLLLFHFTKVNLLRLVYRSFSLGPQTRLRAVGLWQDHLQINQFHHTLFASWLFICCSLFSLSLARKQFTRLFIWTLKNTTLSNGYLGSRNDEERSEMRYVMRIAEFSESSNLWTQIALLGSPRSTPLSVSVQQSLSSVFGKKCIVFFRVRVGWIMRVWAQWEFIFSYSSVSWNTWSKHD